MRFTQGIWVWRDGVRAVLPHEVVEVEEETDALTVYAQGSTPAGRGSTLNTPLLSVRFTSPLADVIHVEIVHFQGTRQIGPHFTLHEETPEVQITRTADAVAFHSGALQARVALGQPWRLEFHDADRLLTASGKRALAYVRDADNQPYVREQLDLAVDEYVYGLGERFSTLARNGQCVEMWNDDPGTASDLAYKNVPFYLTNKGYGVFVNSPGPVSFEVGTEQVDRVGFSLPGERLDYFVIYGPSPLEILDKYTALTGRPALPPPWTFGLWLTTSFLTEYDEATVTGFIQGMADRALPLSVFHFDCFWMQGFHWCDFTWDAAMFPDPAGFLQRLKARGLHLCVWINPYIAQRSALFAEGLAHGYLLKTPRGDVKQVDRWQAGMGYVDFTNPEACRWYAGHLRRLLQMGVDCFKTDFGELIPTDVAYHDGSDPLAMHNYYTYLYNKTVFDLLVEERGAGEAVLFARSATAGGQQFPVHWGGDSEATYVSMADSLRGGLSLCSSGFGFWSHDIGGFENTATPALYKRWVAFGLLSSHSRLHGSKSYRVPWNFDEEAVAVLRHFTQLKCRLMPYLFAAAVEAHTTGAPLMRAMVLEYPNDPACTHLERQYLLGPALLVAPVFSDQGPVEYYLPAGRWTDFFTGAMRDGGRWMREESLDFFRIPLWVRENSVLALGTEETRPDYDFADGVTLRCYQLADGADLLVRIPTATGDTAARFRVRRDGLTVTVRREQGNQPWRVEIAGGERVAIAADVTSVQVSL